MYSFNLKVQQGLEFLFYLIFFMTIHISSSKKVFVCLNNADFKINQNNANFMYTFLFLSVFI